MMNQDEDEWSEIRARFVREGFNMEALKPEEKIVLVWRWLVDTESNLNNSRRMCNKLREQQNEEIEEMANYVGKMREVSEKRTIDMENESTKLQQILNNITEIMDKVVLQVHGESIIDKINCLVSDYLKLVEEVKVLNKLKLSHPKSSDIIAELIGVSTERDALKRQIIELQERMNLLQKSSRELELDNEKLAFKLAEAFAELEEKEIRIGELSNIYGEDSNTFSSLNSKPRESKSTLPSMKPDCQSNERHEDLINDFGSDTTSPSLLLNDLSDCKLNSKLSSLMSSCHETARLEENKKLQLECESLKSRMTILGERYNNLALKYIQLKAKKKFQCEELRGRLDASLCHVETLQVQLGVQRQRLRAEEIFRKQIEADLRKSLDEKRNVVVRLQNSELEQRENNREMIILQKKISMLDTANADLLAQLLKIKYKESSCFCSDELPANLL